MLGVTAVALAQSFTITLQPNTLPAATRNSAYSQTITAVGGNSPYTFDLASGSSLPAGLSLSSGGVLSGTPTVNGAFTFRIEATDAGANTGFRDYSLNIGTAGGMSVNPGSLPNGSENVPYSQTISGSGGTGPYTFTISSGSLPPGLSLASGGALTGTPTTAGSYTFTVRGADSVGNTDTQTYNVDIGGDILTISPTTLSNGQQGTPYTDDVDASGGSGGYTFSVSSGSLPAGLSLNSGTGGISGTPTGSGTSTFTIRAIDSSNNTGARSYSVYIGVPNTLTLSPASPLPNGARTQPYSQTITASGGIGGYSYAVTAGSLPAGLSLSGGGVLSGTPSATGTSTFTVTATDSGFNTGSRAYSLTIDAAPIDISPPSIPAGTLGNAYNQTLTASQGTGPYTFAITAGSLPPGLTMGTTGPSTSAITGTPTATGAYTFTVQATDALAVTGTRSYTLNVGSNILTITPGTLPNGTQGTAYSQTVSGNGGTGPYTFSLASGALPAGLSLGAGGAITGTPTATGPASFTIATRDSVGNIGSQAYTMNIGSSSVLTVNPTTVTPGTLAVPYSQTVTATGGTGPYTFALASGALPAGLTISSGGVISGTPSATGSSTFSVRAVDSLGNAGARSFTMSIGTVSLTVNPTTLPPAVGGASYRANLSATGGTAPYTFSVSSGTLPAGLSLSSTGVLSGTPRGFTSGSFTIQAMDVNGNIGTRAYVLSQRADPTQDPEVRGLVTAQVAAARRFAGAQIDNVTRHLESLHDNFNPCSLNFGIMPQQNDQALGYNGMPYGDPYSPQYGMPGNPYAPPPPPSAQPRAECTSSMAVWTSGNVQFGKQTPLGQAGNNFATAGITAGIDYRASDNLIVGGALGYGGDRSEIGNNGTRTNSTSYSGTLYASFKPLDPLFLDGAVGFGLLDYDNRRFVTSDGSFATGNRSGSYWFASLTASFELRNDRFKFAPYARIDYSSISLDEYSEQGSGTGLLTFEKMTTNTTSGAIGLRGSVDIPTSWGTLTPTARIEYRQVLEGAYDQPIYYSDIGSSMTATLTQESASRGQTMGAIGFRARAFGGLSVEVEYGLTSGANSMLAHTVRAALKMSF